MSRWLDERGLGDRSWTAGLTSGIRVEELSEEGVHVIRAELPGVDPEKDVEISVHDGLLHLSCQRSEKQEDRDNGPFRSEFRYGRFERAVPLPAGATIEDVAATYKDGVLEVRLPLKAATQAASKVPVQRIS